MADKDVLTLMRQWISIKVLLRSKKLYKRIPVETLKKSSFTELSGLKINKIK